MDRAEGSTQALGELRERIRMVHERILEGETPRFSVEFVLADVTLDPGYPRRFSEYSGDLSGRLFGALAKVPPPDGAEETLARPVRWALHSQREDGRFGSEELEYTPEEIGKDHMALLWGNGRMLVGLLEYHATAPDAEVLEAAKRLGAFLLGVREACAEDDVVKRLEGMGAAGFICLTQFIEGFVLLAEAADDPQYIEASRQIAPLLQPRGVQHSHGYLTTLRGILMLYEATGEAEHLRFVEDKYRALLDSPDYLVYGGVAEYFGGKGDRDEGCSEADLLRLALQLWRVTQNPAYLEDAERCLLNQFFANQFRTGDFGHHLLFEHGIAPCPGVGRAWWCCTMHGLRAFRDVLDGIVHTEDGAVCIDLFLEARCAREGLVFTTERFDAPGAAMAFRITIDEGPEKELGLAIRQPSWAGPIGLSVNGESMPTEETRKGYATLSRQWSAGDQVEVRLPCHTRLVTREGTELPPSEIGTEPVETALFHGPYLLGVHESSDPLFFGEPWQSNVIYLPPALRAFNTSSENPLAVPGMAFETTYIHGGFPEPGEAILRPISERSHHAQQTIGVWLRFSRQR